jgi:hypothetical protein
VTNALADGSPNIFGSWVTANSGGTVESELTLNMDGTYKFIVLVPTSSVTGDELTQEGTFTLSGAHLTLTPTEQTCPGALTPSTYTYAVDASLLVLIDSSGNTVYYGATDAVIGSALTTLIVGCSVNSGPWMPEPTSGSAPTPADPGANPTPYGNWLNVTNGTTTLFTLNSDGTYALTALAATSTETGDEYIQKGTFVLEGADIIFTPQQASCPGNLPVSIDTYGINASGLSTTDAGGNQVGYEPTTMTSLGQNLTTIVVGCSVNGGAWMPEPVASVGN